MHGCQSHGKDKEIQFVLKVHVGQRSGNFEVFVSKNVFETTYLAALLPKDSSCMVSEDWFRVHEMSGKRQGICFIPMGGKPEWQI